MSSRETDSGGGSPDGLAQCPACGASVEHADSFIAVCRKCGHRWLSRSEEDHHAVDSATFTLDYAGYRADPKYVDATTRVVRAELVTRVPPPARMLDVGCGAGDLMAVAQTLGYTVEGIDISQASVEICRSRHLEARADDFLTCEFGDRFDLITMWDVVAHLREPVEFLRRAHSLLTERGMLFVKTPALGDFSVSLARRWPRLAGTLLRAPSHSQYFDRESLTAALSRSGFDPEWVSGGRARSPAAGGSLKRRAARRLRRVVSRISGDTNLYVVGRPAA